MTLRFLKRQQVDRISSPWWIESLSHNGNVLNAIVLLFLRCAFGKCILLQLVCLVPSPCL